MLARPTMDRSTGTLPARNRPATAAQLAAHAQHRQWSLPQQSALLKREYENEFRKPRRHRARSMKAAAGRGGAKTTSSSARASHLSGSPPLHTNTSSFSIFMLAAHPSIVT
ncbi:hypothetical protein SETIT_8G188200v2 [Setaria italica]|uniref:Uncharacterized protein n=1 Tax=Setaria italica TaxID=4555 RepID=A0A368SB00_SETIT|nr:hypothetical protein SETIT_8G188200v2 [Setaria italica]